MVIPKTNYVTRRFRWVCCRNTILFIAILLCGIAAWRWFHCVDIDQFVAEHGAPKIICKGLCIKNDAVAFAEPRYGRSGLHQLGQERNVILIYNVNVAPESKTDWVNGNILLEGFVANLETMAKFVPQMRHSESFRSFSGKGVGLWYAIVDGHGCVISTSGHIIINKIHYCEWLTDQQNVTVIRNESD